MARKTKSDNQSATPNANGSDKAVLRYKARDEKGLSENPTLYSFQFDTVFADEHAYSSERRKMLGLAPLSAIEEKKLRGKAADRSIGLESYADRRDDIPVTGLAGLACSGGGIRSAAFCLGVSQALDALVSAPTAKSSVDQLKTAPSIFQHMDYISTVSGGGYLGSTLTAGLTSEDGMFPVPSTLTKDEPPVLQHIRDHSNYLFPNGGIFEKFRVLGSYLRGIAANLPIIVCLMAIALAVTKFTNQSLTDLNDASFVIWELKKIPSWIPVLGGVEANKGFFALTTFVAILVVFLLFVWALVRSIKNRPEMETKSEGARFMSFMFFALLTLFFIELQPRMISGVHAQYCEKEESIKPFEEKGNEPGDPVDRFDAASCGDLEISRPEKSKQFEAVISSVKVEAGDDAACGGDGCAGVELSLEESSASTKDGDGTFFQTIVSNVQQLTVIVAGVTGLYAALSGIFGSGEAPSNQTSGFRGMLRSYGSLIGQFFAGLLLPLAIWIAYLYLAFWSIAGVGSSSSLAFAHAPEGFRNLFPAGWLESGYTVILIYLAISALAFVLTLIIRTNSNSPHNLYRDSLAKAFIVRASGKDAVDSKPATNNLKLSDVEPVCGKHVAPIHLFNAALNIQGSDAVNGRGRNASFFTFSPTFCGSFETGYVHTRDLELAEKDDFTLSSAMAISAAAASSAMGSMTMKGLAATFALLNVRMGYWMVNPRNIAKAVHDNGQEILSKGSLFSRFDASGSALFFRELFGEMGEDKPLVYLSDGGHIENLGLYELLKRRCKTIIVVDGEADSSLEFGSFVTAQRYARIDLGTRIDLSFDQITAGNKAAREELNPMLLKRAAKDDAPAKEEANPDRPHVAIGRIYYPGIEGKQAPQTGLLVYVKLSMSGDENDYVRSYAKRYRAFPHETTGDQFFSEEQFEAYRALGFHAAFKGLGGEAAVQCGDQCVLLTGPGGDLAKQIAALKKVKASSRDDDLIETLQLFHEAFPNIRTKPPVSVA